MTTAPLTYKSTAWLRLRRHALDRARHRCQRCGTRRGVLVAHHRDGLGMTGPRALDLTNLEVLCRGCHGDEHGHHRPD